ncbi:MAG: helicase-related protein [Janthinobacterium lividum]
MPPRAGPANQHDARTAPPAVAATVGVVAVRLTEAMAAGDVLFVAADEQRAEAVAAALHALAPGAVVVHCPSSDALPGDIAPASPANAGRRVAALRRLRLLQLDAQRRPVALVTTAEAAARLYPPPAEFDAAPPTLAVGAPLDLEGFSTVVQELGYDRDEIVDAPGEVALRGQVIDIFPADARLPARVEVADGTIVAIRSYDPVSQLGTVELDRLEIGRAHEPSADADAATVFDYLPHAAIMLDVDALARRDRFIALADDALRGRASAGNTVIDAGRWAAATAGCREIRGASGPETAVPRFVEHKAPRAALVRFAKAAFAGGDRIVFVGGARDLRFLGRRLPAALGTDFTEIGEWADVAAAPAGSVLTLVVPIAEGWRTPGVVVIAAADLLGSRAVIDAAATSINPLLGEAGQIGLGDVVVHEEFGIGVVGGLERLPGDSAGDAIVLGYADGGRRLVPADEADRIWRYGADADAVALDRLDGSSWQKRRGAIDAAIAESARALAAMAAERAARSAVVLDPDPAAYERFAAGFPFNETADQARAIAAVRDDLASGRPMDRLIIGDVGYGKTEVAMRAAALAALAGAQVAIAAPTTVLVRQHVESFRRRFDGTGIVVASLSRLSSAAEKKAVKAGLADGSIGVVVGTGAIAGKGIAYRRLGLVMIDEEQRFGTADKNRLRGLGGGHALALSATPIPRTLQMALVGLQQISIIATPPARRQPIRTSLGVFDPGIVRTALIREKGRGGQSFVVVARIEDIAPMAEQLARLVPELSVAVAHGKMPAVEIDENMIRFASGDGDVLLATNIIEAGLDVPRANTMIVWRADRFGLSQLHQLRGRVGRGSRRGQVLLLTDATASIAPATVKRLQTLQAFDRLGAGFDISARDLDMRGAGDLIGEAQAGHVKLIGVDLYQYLLGAALRSARGEAVDRWTPDLNLGIAGALPETWIPDVAIRVALYARLARLTDDAALDAFENELEDRFGALHPEAAILLQVARIRLLARRAEVARVDAGPAAVAVRLRHGATIDAGALGLDDRDGRLILAEKLADPVERLARVGELLGAIAEA